MDVLTVITTIAGIIIASAGIIIATGSYVYTAKSFHNQRKQYEEEKKEREKERKEDREEIEKERLEKKEERTIRGKEKQLHAFASTVFADDGGYHFPLAMRGYENNKENIWVVLDHIYKNKDLITQSNKLLSLWPITKSINDIYETDEKVRKYYGMKEPAPLYQDV